MLRKGAPSPYVPRDMRQHKLIGHAVSNSGQGELKGSALHCAYPSGSYGLMGRWKPQETAFCAAGANLSRKCAGIVI